MVRYVYVSAHTSVHVPVLLLLSRSLAGLLLPGSPWSSWRRHPSASGALEGPFRLWTLASVGRQGVGCLAAGIQCTFSFTRKGLSRLQAAFLGWLFGA